MITLLIHFFTSQAGFFESEKKLRGHSVPRHQRNRSELANLEKKLSN